MLHGKYDRVRRILQKKGTKTKLMKLEKDDLQTLNSESSLWWKLRAKATSRAVFVLEKGQNRLIVNEKG